MKGSLGIARSGSGANMSDRNGADGDGRRVVVFTGPSLHPDEARTVIDAAFLPPVKRGDLEAVLSMEPKAVAIIDGEFYQNLAVSPKEILPLLDGGVQVYGASSMGALRAVELCKFGMIGFGSVFRLFRSGCLDADDEVALAYCPWTYRPMSEPLVNTRYALRAAVRKRILIRAEAAEIISRLKTVYFPERTRELVLRHARAVVGIERAGRLADFLAAEAPNVKRRDAIGVLEGYS